MGMKKNRKKSNFSANFFTKERPKVTPSNNVDDYSKIEEIKWNKDVLSGKTKVVGSLPKNKKMI